MFNILLDVKYFSV